MVFNLATGQKFQSIKFYKTANQNLTHIPMTLSIQITKFEFLQFINACQSYTLDGIYIAYFCLLEINFSR